MPNVRRVRTRTGGTCDAEFFHPNLISPGDIVRVTTYFPSDEHAQHFGVRAFTRWRVCQWCVLRDEMLHAQRNEWGHLRFKDKQGDVWQFGTDGLLHTPETVPFSFEHVQRKWGPLCPPPRALYKAGRKERMRCHECNCHSMPCGNCENCVHTNRPECENDCQTCEEHDDE